MKKILCVALALTCAFTLFACGSSTSDAGTVNKDTLNVVISADPDSLDPHDNVGPVHHQVTRQIFETLLVRDSEGKLKPWLAESWEYENDTTLVLHIRKGVKFHNGDELKASDVLFSMKRMRDDNVAAAIQVIAVDFDQSAVIDDYTVKIVTTAPSPMFLAQLENPLSCVISEKVYKENNGKIYDVAVGTGPYKLVSYDSGDKVTLVANDDYWIADQPKIKNVVMRIISDSSSRAIEAESGGADIVYDIINTDITRVSAAENVNVMRVVSANTQYITFNTAKKPLDDLRVRQAIFYALDRPQIISLAYDTLGMKANGFISPTVEGHVDQSDKLVARDVGKARQLLTEAGYPDGLTLEILAPNSDKVRMDVCEAAQAQLAEAGIALTINYKDYNTWISDTIAGNTNLSVYGFTASTGEAGRILMRWLPEYSESTIYSWYDETYMETCRQALQTIDDTERNGLFAQCQNMLLDNCIAYPLAFRELSAAVQKNVKGFEMQSSYEQHYLQTVYFE